MCYLRVPFHQLATPPGFHVTHPEGEPCSVFLWDFLDFPAVPVLWSRLVCALELEASNLASMVILSPCTNNNLLLKGSPAGGTFQLTKNVSWVRISPATLYSLHFCGKEDVSWFVKSLLGSVLVRGENAPGDLCWRNCMPRASKHIFCCYQ